MMAFGQYGLAGNPGLIAAGLSHDHCTRSDPSGIPQPNESLCNQILPVRRIEKDQRRQCGNRGARCQCVHTPYRGPVPSPARRDIRPQGLKRSGIFLHKASRSCPARQRLQPERAGARKDIQHDRTLNQLPPAPRGMHQHVEQSLPHTVRCWPRPLPRRRNQRPASPGASDNPHPNGVAATVAARRHPPAVARVARAPESPRYRLDRVSQAGMARRPRGSIETPTDPDVPSPA